VPGNLQRFQMADQRLGQEVHAAGLGITFDSPLQPNEHHRCRNRDSIVRRVVHIGNVLFQAVHEAVEHLNLAFIQEAVEGNYIENRIEIILKPNDNLQ